MNCRSARGELAAYLDGALDRARATEVEGHLTACPDCRAEIEGLRERIALLRAVRHPAAPAGLWDRIRDAVARRPTARPASRFVRVAMPAAAAVLLAVALGFGIPAARNWTTPSPRPLLSPPKAPHIPGGILDVAPDNVRQLADGISSEDEVMRYLDEARILSDGGKIELATDYVEAIAEAVKTKDIKLGEETTADLKGLRSELRAAKH